MQVLHRVHCRSALDMNVYNQSDSQDHRGSETDFYSLAVGVVEGLGSAVSGFTIGDRVGFMPASETCGLYPTFYYKKEGLTLIPRV